MTVKAVALVSGGLDSTLATKLIQEQGIEIIALNFKTPFCLCDRHGASGCVNYSRRVAEALGIELRTMNITDEFFKILAHPKHGYGSQMNPCIDCRILKFSQAKEFMPSIGASFIITGEVLGQRPMSQHRKALKIIDKESGLEGLVLRPLSAKLLEETIPERNSWVSRERLLNFNGRSRKPQMDLAREFNIKDYPCPAGGCLLTDPAFAKRIKDLIKYGSLDLNSVELLKVGRHLRLNENARLIVGRNEKENARLENLAQEKDLLFWPVDIAGPIALGRGNFSEALIRFCCSVTLRYSDLNGHLHSRIAYRRIPDSEEKVLDVAPIPESQMEKLRI